jgi:microcystin-dependent protein
MSDPYIGEIRMFTGNFAPLNWAFCDGSIIAIVQNTALFSLIGTTYGGDGVQTFALPDLRGRAPIHQGTGAGLTPRVCGQAFGSENVTLLPGQLPTHTHTAQGSAGGNAVTPKSNFWSTDPEGNTAPYASGPPNAQMNAVAVGVTGNSQSHPNMSPFLAVSYIISLFGIYPSQS